MESLFTEINFVNFPEDSVEWIRDQLAIMENVELDDPQSDDDEDLST